MLPTQTFKVPLTHTLERPVMHARAIDDLKQTSNSVIRNNQFTLPSHVKMAPKVTVLQTQPQQQSRAPILGSLTVDYKPTETHILTDAQKSMWRPGQMIIKESHDECIKPIDDGTNTGLNCSRTCHGIEKLTMRRCDYTEFSQEDRENKYRMFRTNAQARREQEERLISEYQKLDQRQQQLREMRMTSMQNQRERYIQALIEEEKETKMY